MEGKLPPTWIATGSMAEPHGYGAIAMLLPDGKVLVTGGENPVAHEQLYDPVTGRWTETRSMADWRFDFTATLLADGRVLVAGGRTAAGVEERLASAELYDPGSGRWTAIAAMATARGGHTATLLPDGGVLVAGGHEYASGVGSRGWLASAEVYDPGSGRWTTTGNLITPRGGHAATLLPNGRVLVAGGATAGATSSASAEMYDPGSGRWTATGTMINARYVPAITGLQNGTVLVVGSGDNDANARTAELYDPSSGRWTATGSLDEARHTFTSTLLADGQVLVAGGRSADRFGGAMASAELYDPTRGRWTPTASMGVGRIGASSTPLRDGRVLVVGGYEDTRLTSAELYDPEGGLSDDEAYLLSGLRSDARYACAARRVDLPPRAVAGVECSPEIDFVDRIGVYLFTTQDDLLQTYFDRLAGYGIEPRSGSCPQRPGEHAYVPGDSGPTFEPYRYGCYLNEFGKANYRFTDPNSLVYVGILGTGTDHVGLHEWAWLGNQDAPGSPTVWRG